MPLINFICLPGQLWCSTKPRVEQCREPPATDDTRFALFFLAAAIRSCFLFRFYFSARATAEQRTQNSTTAPSRSHVHKIYFLVFLFKWECNLKMNVWKTNCGEHTSLCSYCLGSASPTLVYSIFSFRSNYKEYFALSYW